MKTQKITVQGESVTVYIDGSGAIPCMFVGAAGLFIKPGMIPDALKETFTFYFVDLWDKSGVKAEERYDNLDWNKITGEMNQAREQLGLDKIVVMGQSAAGAMPIEYARKYPANCLLVVPVAFSPNWAKEAKETEFCRNGFIELNADRERRELIETLDKTYKKQVSEMKAEEAFIERFKADRALYWADYKTAEPRISYMWKDYHPNVDKAIAYAARVLKGYNFFDHTLENVPILWCLGIYDYSAPIPLLTDALGALKKTGKLSNVDYYLFTSGHYPMTEAPKEFTQVLQEKIHELRLPMLR